MSGTGTDLERKALTDAISASMVQLYAVHYGHERTTGTTYINDNVVLCVPGDILSTGESRLIAEDGASEVIDGRVAF